MPANYVLLEKITVGSGGATFVKFSSIPQTGYTDLVLKGSTRTTRAAVTDYCYIYPNGSADMSGMRIGGDGSSVGSSGGTTSAYTTFAIPGANSTANTFGNFEIYFPNYNSTTTYKSFSEDIVAENNATLAESGLNAILYKSNTAISNIEIYPSVGPFAQYSTFYLYGVAKLGTTPAIVPYATGGDIIETDGTYWYHAFLSSGTFTPQKGLSCDVLTIAGGGSGGGDNGAGGGGAGGLYYSSGNSVASARTVTIGAGAAGKTVGGNGFNGSNSQFGSLTAAVGGGYGAGSTGDGQDNAGGSGGSGGGACSSRYGSGGAAGGSATSGQGFAGGTTNSAGRNGGGGGGAGAVGANGTAEYAGGAGGIGSSAYSSWGLVTGTGQNVSGTVYYAGGGGGWSGANGGSGGGAKGSLDLAGTPNTGGGGGSNNGQLGAGAANGGGSGIVIVRYAV